MAVFNYEVFACSIKTLTNPYRSFVAAFRKPLKTHKMYPNAAVILKIGLKKRPAMTCIRGRNGPVTERTQAKTEILIRLSELEMGGKVVSAPACYGSRRLSKIQNGRHRE